MILVCGGIKGGTGKTTIATNLAVSRCLLGKRVLLIDADEQQSASCWAEIRSEHHFDAPDKITTISLSLGNRIHDQISRLAKNYDDIIVDVGGRDTISQRSALMIADVFLVPFKPRSLDIWTVAKVRSLIEEIQLINPKLIPMLIINQADAKGSDNQEAVGTLADAVYGTLISCGPMIGARKAFSNAAALGLGILETKKVDSKAAAEFVALCNSIYN